MAGAFAGLLPDGGAVLDLGCGAGEPFTRWFLERGFRVTGVDAAAAMLAIARQRFPGGDWRRAHMRHLDLDGRFDGIIGRHGFFHLTGDEQRAALPRLADHLNPDGALLLTVGPADAEAVGQVGGERVYHASLAPDEYEARLMGLGLGVVSFVKEYPGCHMSTLLLARRTDGDG